jgi:hypothetical protein
MTGTGDAGEWRALVSAVIGAAGQAVELIGRPEVAARWDEPSALAEMTVGGLASHLAQMLAGPVGWLQAGPDLAAGRTVVSLVEMYGRVRLDPDLGLADPVATTVREWASDGADAGAADVALAARSDLDRLGALLPGADPATPIPSVLVDGIAMTLADYLRTRCVEFVVHGDDLAASIGVAPPTPLPAAADITVTTLMQLCRARAGDAAVIRALTRTERADPEALRAM